MFIGHYGAGLGGQALHPLHVARHARRRRAVARFVWPTLLMLGIERVRIAPGNTRRDAAGLRVLPLDAQPRDGPRVGGCSPPAAYASFRRQSRGAGIVAAAVLSHWVLDFVTHRPDLPLWPPNGPVVGLGLWNSVAGTLAAEALLFSVGVWLYATHTEPTDSVGRYALVRVCRDACRSCTSPTCSARRRRAPRPSPSSGRGNGCSCSGRSGLTATASRSASGGRGTGSSGSGAPVRRVPFRCGVPM